MFYQIVIILSVIWYSMYRWKNRHLFKLANRLHSNCIGPVLPVIGQSYIFRGDSEDRMKTLQKIGRLTVEKGGILAMWQSRKLCISITDADVIDLILKTCLEKDDLMEFFSIFLGNGSILTPVKFWRPRRKATAPIFTQTNLRHFSKVFAHQSEVLAARLRGFADMGPVALAPFLSAYALDSISESTFGVSVDAQALSKHPFPISIHKLTSTASNLIFQPYLHYKSIYRMYCYLTGTMKHANMVRNFVDSIIEKKRETLKQVQSIRAESDQPLSRKDIVTFVELYMQSSGAGRKLTDLELREEAVVLVIAASDTSAVGASFTAMMLARHQDVQEKVYQEIKEVLGKTYRPLTSEDLPRLKYLEAVIKETLRLYPPAPFIVRKVITDITLPTGVTLYKGCSAVVHIQALHRNPKYWGDDADSFKPERFLDTALAHPAAYIPFSYGPRGCLGYKYAMMSMMTVLATLLQQYRILAPNDSPDASLNSSHDEAANPLRVYYSIMMKDVSNFTVKLKSRQ